MRNFTKCIHFRTYSYPRTPYSVTCRSSKSSKLDNGTTKPFSGSLGKTFCSVGVCTYDGVAIESHSQVAEEKVGVLLLNLGGPETLNDVQPFLFNLFADPVCLW